MDKKIKRIEPHKTEFFLAAVEDTHDNGLAPSARRRHWRQQNTVREGRSMSSQRNGHEAVMKRYETVMKRL